jgi:hypothetical protein
MTGKKMEVNLTLLLAGLCIVLAGGMGGGFTYFLAGQWENKADIQETEKDQEKEYILYIGLNDKDEYRQIISTEEAQEIINAICIRYVDGYTMSKAEGAWVDEKGILTSEETLVYTIRGEKENIIRVMDDILPALNQNAILLEEKSSDFMFYNGIQEEGFYDENGK